MLDQREKSLILPHNWTTEVILSLPSICLYNTYSIQFSKIQLYGRYATCSLSEMFLIVIFASPLLGNV